VGTSTALLIADLVGVAVFAASGGSAGVRREIYAVAALIGAMAVALGQRAGLPVRAVLLGAAALSCGIRVVALTRNWSAPVAGQRYRADRE
jgi:uncharacterized membrane protein YeiH